MLPVFTLFANGKKKRQQLKEENHVVTKQQLFTRDAF